MRVHKNKFEKRNQGKDEKKRNKKKKRRDGANEKSSPSMAIVLNLVENWKHEKFAS